MNDWERALHLFETFVLENEPDIILYSSILSSLGRNGRTVELAQIFNELKYQHADGRISITTSIFNTVISAYGQRGDWVAADETFKTMEALGVKYDKVWRSQLTASVNQRQRSQSMHEPHRVD